MEMVGWTEAQWPVLSLCYREGSVLDVFGEKTSDATIKEVLEETCKLHWKGEHFICNAMVNCASNLN